MTVLYGNTVNKRHLTHHVGNMSQIGGVKAYELTSGQARGVQALDVRTGTGFEFTVLPGRGLDIAWASYKGVPIGYISKAGVVAAPHFAESGVFGFLRNFYAGLLTTAGLSNIGNPSSDEAELHGLHGRISNTEADDISVQQDWVGDDFVITIGGVLRQARLFGECLVLRRQISAKLGDSKLVIRDTLENAGVRPEPVLLLYHCNFGYPIVGPATRLTTSGGRVEARDEHAKTGLASHDRFQEPTSGYLEQCFYHHLGERPGRAHAALFNPDIGLGAYVSYNSDNLPLLVEWKMMGEQDYVVGLEPASARLDGRKNILDQQGARMLTPGEKLSFDVEIGVFEEKDQALSPSELKH